MSDVSVGLAVPLWLAVIVVVAAGSFAFWTYRDTVPPLGKSKRYVLASLRTVGIALLLLALFDTVMEFQSVNVQDPMLAVGFDNSESMALDGTDGSRFDDMLRVNSTIRSEVPTASLPFVFSDSVRGLESISDSLPQPVGVETNMENVMTFVADSMRTQNIRALLVATDGRYNSGKNPLFDAEELGIPVFVIGLGDSVEPADIVVEELFVNEVAYKETSQPIQVRLRSSGLSSGTATLAIKADGVVIDRKSVDLRTGIQEYVVNSTWEPKREGRVRISAEVAPIERELTTQNNRQSRFATVRSNRRKHIVLSGSPNPDFAFIQRHLGNDPDVEVKTYVQRDESGFIEGSLTAGSFRDAETVILIDFPTSETPDGIVGLVSSAVSRLNLPLFVFMGSNVDYAKLGRLERHLPVTIGAIRPQEMQVVVEPARDQQQRALGLPTDSSVWTELPPVFRSETAFQPKPGSNILATSRLISGRLTDPFIVSMKSVGRRTLFVAGYGIWRWQLIGEGRSEARGESAPEVLAPFIEGAARWLAVREEQKQVRIETSKDVYRLGETVRFFGQVYDESYLPVDNAEVTVDVSAEGVTRALTLTPLGNGRFEGLLSRLPEGDYRFSGTAVVDNSQLGADDGRFLVDEQSMEFQRTSLNTSFLRGLAERTGGQFYTMDNYGQLLDDLKNHSSFGPRSVESRTGLELRQLIWFLLAAIAMFAIEWFLRKRHGLL